MKYTPWCILLSALAAMTGGVLLLFVAAAVEGDRFTGLVIVAGGVALLVLWAKIDSRRPEMNRAMKEPQPDPANQALLARKWRSIRIPLYLAGLLLIALGVIQGLCGQVCNCGIHPIMGPGRAGFVSGCIVVLGVGVVGALCLAHLHSGRTWRPSGEGQEKTGVAEGGGTILPDASSSGGGES